MKRYVVRHEYFGGLVYDREKDSNILIDEDFYLALSALNNASAQKAVDDDTLSFLEAEGFLRDGTPNYRLIDSGFIDETLSAPGRVHFYYTSACNLNCAHCFTKNAATSNELKFEEKLYLLDQMYELGVNEILIGGGEPFTQSDFPDFVEACLEKGIATKVYTNGLLLSDPSLIERISKWNLRFLSISIDGADEEEYEKTRGVKGLAIIKENLKLLKQRCSFKIDASVTISPYNFNNAEKLLDLIADLGFDRVKIRPVKPAGNVMHNRDVFLSAEQYVSFIKKAQAIWNEKYKDCFTLKFSWGDTRLVYNPIENTIVPLDLISPYEGYGCYAGKVNIVFDAAGNALTCGFLPDSLSKSETDNLRNKTLKEIWTSGSRFVELRNLSGNPACKKCEYYGICRGGCISRNLFIGRDINLPDPWCLRKYFPIKV